MTSKKCYSSTDSLERPTCSMMFDNDSISSVQYQCDNFNKPILKSIMVNATDPKSQITAPFQLKPGEGCGSICSYTLGQSPYQVKEIQFGTKSLEIDSFSLDTSPLCQP